MVSFADMSLADSSSCCRQLSATQMVCSVVIGQSQQTFSQPQLHNHKTLPRINLHRYKMGLNSDKTSHHGYASSFLEELLGDLRAVIQNTFFQIVLARKKK